MKLEQHRQQFPGLANKVYFNFGGQGTMPQAALFAIIDAHEYIQQLGPFSLRVNAWIKQKIALTRKTIADELGVQAETITFTENVTTGCNIVLWGINWQACDHILITDGEHPGVIAIIQEISRRFGVQVTVCPLVETLNEGEAIAVIEKYLQANTKLLVISHILWNTGQVLPLADIVKLCHGHQVQVLVDAAQSVGCLPLNLQEIEVDFYAFTGHKWLCGPGGVGGLYINQRAKDDIAPTFIGWRGINVDGNGQPSGQKTGGERFEVATSAYATYEGLRVAIATHQEWGTCEERYQQICDLSKYLWQGLSQIDGVKCLKASPPEAGLVSFQVTKNITHEQMTHNLESQGFLLRTIADPNCIRACVHYFTMRAEIEQLVAVIDKIIHSNL